MKKNFGLYIPTGIILAVLCYLIAPGLHKNPLLFYELPEFIFHTILLGLVLGLIQWTHKKDKFSTILALMVTPFLFLILWRGIVNLEKSGMPWYSSSAIFILLLLLFGIWSYQRQKQGVS